VHGIYSTRDASISDHFQYLRLFVEFPIELDKKSDQPHEQNIIMRGSQKEMVGGDR